MPFQQKILLCCAFIFAPGLCAGPSFETRVLDNGIKVIVLPDTSANVAALEVVYRVGGFAESRPDTGISHMLEHMMFQGTKEHPKESFTEALSKMGGVLNAFTTEDYTAYHELVPVEYLPEVFVLEADRLDQLTLADEDFIKEIEVVKEERRLRVDDVPFMQLRERLMASYFPSGPYHDPLIGWMDDLNRMTSEQVRQWYEQWYCADNVSIIVAGNVEPSAIFSLSEKTFGKKKRCPNALAVALEEVSPMGPMTLEAHIQSAVPMLALAYRAPSFGRYTEHWEPFAMTVAMNILDGGFSTRFEKELVREDQIASAVWAYYDPFARFETSVVFGGIPMPDISLDRLERSIGQQLRRIKDESVTEDELAMAKVRLKAQKTFEQDDLMSRIRWFGHFEGIGQNAEDGLSWEQNIEQVTAQQVQDIVGQYLNAQNQIQGTIPSVRGAAQNA